MARNLRQSKILEVIANNAIETQEELCTALKNANCEVTQATISRDIKELGLIKILDEASKKYKYAVRHTEEQAVSNNRFTNIFKESVIKILPIENMVVIKTIKGLAGTVSSFIDKFNLDYVVGSVFGDDTVMVIVSDREAVMHVNEKLSKILFN